MTRTIGIALLLLAEGAAAQTVPEPATGLGEIIVTARKRAESITDAPVTISAFTGEQLRDLGGAPRLTDLGYLLPGVTFINTGNINSEINIRGAGAGTARTAGVDSAIAVLRDGASIIGGNIGGRTFTTADLFDLERIEVIRGPQSSLYGVNAVGGVLNAIVRRPQETLGGSAQASYDPIIDRYELEAIANVPVTNWLALRAGYRRSDKQGGFFTNTVTGKTGDFERYDGGRLSVLFKPADTVKLVVGYDKSKEVTPSNRIKSINVVNDPTGLTAAQIAPPDTDGPFRYTANTSNTTTRNLDHFSGNLDIDAPFGSIAGIFLHRVRHTNFYQDEDGSAPGSVALPFPAASCATRSCTTLFTDDTYVDSGEVRAQSDGKGRFDWLFGVNIIKRKTDFVTTSDGRTTSATNLAPSPNQNTSSVSRDQDVQTSFFATVTVRPFDRLTLDVGGRYGLSDKRIDAYSVNRTPVTGLLCPYLDPINGIAAADPRCVGSRARLQAGFGNFAPSGSVKYQITDHLNVYANIASGYRAGGFNGNSVLDVGIPATFDPETSTAYEIGVKLGGRRLRIAVAGFYNDFDNFLATLARIGADNITRNYRINAGRAETHGVDFEGALNLPLGARRGAVDLSVAVNWLDGKILDGAYKGRTIEGSPEWTYTTTAIYKVPVVRDWRFVATASYRGQRGGFFNTTNIDNVIKNADVDLVNAKIGVENDQFRFEIVADNLFDTVYQTLRDPQRSVYADRRTVLFRAAYRFGSEGAR